MYICYRQRLVKVMAIQFNRLTGGTPNSWSRRAGAQLGFVMGKVNL